MITKENAHMFFLLFDLDGTLVDTDALHVKCYTLAGAKEENLAYKIRRGEHHVPLEIKRLKAKLVEELCFREGIKWMPGVEELLTLCTEWNINYCIVTNTPQKPVQAMCSQLSLLQNAYQQGRLICREEYEQPKPHPDGYQCALNRWYKGETQILGFENTLIGWLALESLRLPNQQNFLVNGQEDEEEVRQRGGQCISSLEILTKNA